MIELQTLRRITVYAEATLESTLTYQFGVLGSTGYCVIPCRGKGERNTQANPFSPTERLRIEVIVQPAVADAIMDYLYSPKFSGRSVVACVETVQAATQEHF